MLTLYVGRAARSRQPPGVMRRLTALLVAVVLLGSVAEAQFVPDDPLYDSWDPLLITSPNSGVSTPNPSDPGQWNLRAIQADEAWEISKGDSAIVIAIIDNAFRLNHPDLQGALWENPGEIAGNGIDDDGNFLVDDVNGWDFFADQNVPFVSSPGIGITYKHATEVTGIAIARTDNQLGVSGVAGGGGG